jgi:hypothetical protein
MFEYVPAVVYMTLLAVLFGLHKVNSVCMVTSIPDGFLVHLVAIKRGVLCLHFLSSVPIGDRLCGLVVRIPRYRSRGPGFDSRHYHIF